ncbi:galactosyltransferase-related protein [bacterium]|nr:galactosyltransferase-related protein [bacterium]
MNHTNIKLQPGVTVISAVKNRSHPLRYSIPSWLSDPLVRQLILVDWDSDTPLWETLSRYDIPGWPDRRTMIIRVVDQPHWQMGKAINLGMKLARHSTTFKVDADVVLVDRLSKTVPTERRSFVAGHYLGIPLLNVNYLYGTIFLATRDFRYINGYDERFDQYGSEDTDLYDRLKTSGLSRLRFEQNQLYHLPHSNNARQVHQKIRHTTPEASIAVSSKIVHSRVRWSRDFETTQFQPVRSDVKNKCFTVTAVV